MNKKIYVVGFPKSGNTWLTRLLADVLDGSAGNGMGEDDSKEVASFVGKKAMSNIKVLKTHFLPKDHMKIEKEPHHIIYVKRDFRDVLISAFFYKNHKVKDALLKNISMIRFLLLLPNKKIEFIKNRKKLFNYAKKLTKGWSENVGSWSENITEWKNFSDKIIISKSFTTYEDLLDNTSGEIEKIIKNTGFEVSQKNIESAVLRQSFGNKKASIQQNKEKIPFGKEFNQRFLRKGTSGDWKRFFTKRLASLISKDDEEMLIVSNYARDNWKETLPKIPLN